MRTSSDENQKPEMSRARQKFTIVKNVLEYSTMPGFGEYIDVLTLTMVKREGYQRMLEDARAGKFSHVIVVERTDRFGRNDTEALRAIDELHQFGIAVRFANSPDHDPQDPDDRVIVTLSFTLARRESTLLGIRVKGGLQAKRAAGGANYAPNGYINVEGKVTGEAKKLTGRHETWIEQDLERAPIIHYAFDLLLQDKLTLEGVCEELHARGYRYRSGRPFIEIKKNGQRKANTNTLSAIFHNWVYAGWLTSNAANMLPKTVHGNGRRLSQQKNLSEVLPFLKSGISIAWCGASTTIS